MRVENVERLGTLADQLDAHLYTARLPIPAKLHVTGLSEKMRHARDLLVEIVIDETGENPWQTNPLKG